MNKNPYQMYKEQAVMTMTQGDMLTAVYDGLLKELALVKDACEKKDFTVVNNRCQKAQVLLRHLQGVLDYKFEISNNLNALYDYFFRVIIQVNVKKKPDELDEIMQMITELRDTFSQADKKARSSEASGKSA